MADISLDNLDNGQEIEVDYEVTGTVTTTSGNASFAAWQIDDKPIQSIVLQGASPNYTFAFTITAADCPDPGCWYMLTVYVWEVGAGGSGNCFAEAVSFKRLGSVGGGVEGGGA